MSILTENRLSKSEMYCAAENHNDACHTSAKGYLDSNFHEEVIDKIPFLSSYFLKKLTNICFYHVYPIFHDKGM